MTVLPADEDYARALLCIFKTRAVRARQSLRTHEARGLFLARNMGRLADFDAALRYATIRGWLAPALDWLRLTTAGADEMQTV